MLAPPNGRRFSGLLAVDINESRQFEARVDGIGMSMAQHVPIVGGVEESTDLARADDESFETHVKLADPPRDRLLRIEYFISAIFQSSSLSISCVSDSGSSSAAVFGMNSVF